MADLTLKQQRFADEFLVDLNATQAAVRAGYSVKTAKQQGNRLLTNVDVQAAVKAAMDGRSERTEVTADRVVAELARIGFSDMASFVEWGPDGVALKASGDLPEDARRCVAEVSSVKTENGGTVKFKLHDKKAALDSLARHLGMYTDNLNLGGTVGIRHEDALDQLK